MDNSKTPINIQQFFAPIRTFDVVIQTLSKTSEHNYCFDGIHGALGFALWNTDPRHEQLKNFTCSITCDCLYRQIFAPTVPLEKQIKTIPNDNPPRPYSLFVYAPHINSNGTSNIHFRINIIGLNHIAGTSIAAAISNIQTISLGDEKIKVVVLSINEIEFSRKKMHFLSKHKSIQINFITPIRIETKGQIVQSLPLYLILERIIWRTRDLNYLYNNGAYIENSHFHQFIDAYKAVLIGKTTLVETPISRYRKKQNLTGWTGNVEYKTNDRSILPLLYYGSQILVGSNTVFGMGAFEILN